MSSKIGSVAAIMQRNTTNKGTVIFLHGSGDTGKGVKEWVNFLLGNDWNFPHLKVLFPTAPIRKYTPLGGEPSHVWFDRENISPDVPEHLDTIEPMGKEIINLIDKEVTSGIPLEHIIIGGFSMGGAMAMHVGYRLKQQVAGVFALSSFLNDNSVVYKHLESDKEQHDLPPLFMCHGDRDDLVPLSWGEETFKNLEKLGVKGHFHTIRNALHELKKQELKTWSEWVKERIPE